MEILREMFQDRPEWDLARALEEASNDIERAIALVLEHPAPPKPKPRPLASLSRIVVGAADVHDAPPLTPATASANLFRNMTLGEDREAVPLQQSGQSSSPPAVASPPKQFDEESEPISNILAIFPDACPDFVKKLYKEHNILQGPNIVEFLANKFADEGYEKKQRTGLKRKRRDSEGEGELRKEATFNDENRPPVTLDYQKTAKYLLSQEFPMIPANFIDRILKENRYFISRTYPNLVSSEKLVKSSKPGAGPYKPLIKGRIIRASDDDLASRRGQSFSKIMEELELARKNARELEMAKQLELDAQLAAQLDEKEHAAVDMIFECKCCFTETPFDQMTHCGEGEHFFCLDCARKNAEIQIGDGRHKLLCMDESGCKAEFPRREVLRFIKKQQTLDLLSKLEAEAAVRMADIDDLVQCPFCDNAAICNSIEIDREFRCDNPECGIISCRHCQRKSHTPKTCEEASQDDKISTRHRLEEAMSEAVMRKCQKCSTPFIKESGCNKMTCTKCQAITCYVCNKIITGYEHFNDPNRGGKSGNCPLFDNHEARHEEEARAAARAVKEQIRTENPDITDKDLEIQLSEAVKKQEEDRRRRAAVGAGAVHPLVIPPYNPALLAGARCHRRHLGIPPPPPRLPMNQLGFEAPGNPPPYQARRELVGNGGPVPAAQVYQPNRYYIPNPGAPPVQIGIPQPVHPQRTRRAAAAAAQPMNAVGAAPQAYQPVQARHARPQPQQQPRNNVGQFQPHAQQYNPGNYGPQTVPPVGRDRRAQAYVPQAQQAQNGRRGVGGR